MEPLEEKCWRCDGRGWRRRIGEVPEEDAIACKDCDGTGYELTLAGERLFQFLRRMPARERFREAHDRPRDPA